MTANTRPAGAMKWRPASSSMPTSHGGPGRCCCQPSRSRRRGGGEVEIGRDERDPDDRDGCRQGASVELDGQRFGLGLAEAFDDWLRCTPSKS